MNKLPDSIHRSAADLFDIPYRQALLTQDFEMTKRPYWISHQWARSFQRIPRGVFDKLLPHGVRRSQLVKKAVEQIDELVMQNVENLRWAVFQNIDHSFIRFRSELGRQFEQTVIATRGAIETALKKRKEHSEIVADEITHLQESLNILTNIKDSLEPSRP
jgi:predicted small secreted protein